MRSKGNFYIQMVDQKSALKSSNYGAALEYLIFKHDELRKTPILDQNGNRIMRDEFYLDGLNCEPYSFDAACQQLNREYQKNKNKNEIKSHHYIISFDPRDSTENCLTGKRAQELGLEYAKANFPGHQALVCTHMDGHNGSGNIHVHIVINSLRKLDVPKQPFMERPIDCKAGYKHHVTNEYLKHLQKSLMDLCCREFLHQVDLLSPSRTGVTEAEYWAQRRLDEKKQEIEEKGFTQKPTKFQTQKQLIRDAVAAACEKAISYEDFQDILQDEYDVFVKTQRGRYSYLPPERNKFISERSLGDSCKRECLEGFFIQNAERNLRYKEDPILIFMTRTGLRLVVDLQENVKAQENLAYALKVKISNLQKMAETLVWVQENNINDLTELNDLCKTAQANTQAAYERLSQAEDELYKINEQIHYAGQYLSTKEVQQQFTKAIFKKKFRAEHSKELDILEILRERERKALICFSALERQEEKLSVEKAEIVKQRVALYEQYADGNMSKEEFIRQRDAYRVQEDERMEQIQRLRTEKDQAFQPVKKDTDNLQAVMNTVGEAGDVMHLSQNVVETFIDRIEVFNDESVKIRFTFEDAVKSYETE